MGVKYLVTVLGRVAQMICFLGLLASVLDAFPTWTAQHEKDPSVPSYVSIAPADIDTHLFFKPASSRNKYCAAGREVVVEIRVFELDELDRTLRVSDPASAPP